MNKNSVGSNTNINLTYKRRSDSLELMRKSNFTSELFSTGRVAIGGNSSTSSEKTCPFNNKDSLDVSHHEEISNQNPLRRAIKFGEGSSYKDFDTTLKKEQLNVYKMFTNYGNYQTNVYVRDLIYRVINNNISNIKLNLSDIPRFIYKMLAFCYILSRPEMFGESDKFDIDGFKGYISNFFNGDFNKNKKLFFTQCQYKKEYVQNIHKTLNGDIQFGKNNGKNCTLSKNKLQDCYNRNLYEILTTRSSHGLLDEEVSKWLDDNYEQKRGLRETIVNITKQNVGKDELTKRLGINDKLPIVNDDDFMNMSVNFKNQIGNIKFHENDFDINNLKLEALDDETQIALDKILNVYKNTIDSGINIETLTHDEKAEIIIRTGQLFQFGGNQNLFHIKNDKFEIDSRTFCSGENSKYEAHLSEYLFGKNTKFSLNQLKLFYAVRNKLWCEGYKLNLQLNTDDDEPKYEMQLQKKSDRLIRGNVDLINMCFESVIKSSGFGLDIAKQEEVRSLLLDPKFNW